MLITTWLADSLGGLVPAGSGADRPDELLGGARPAVAAALASGGLQGLPLLLLLDVDVLADHGALLPPEGVEPGEEAVVAKTRLKAVTYLLA